jgi:hypothetical protein
MQYKYTIRLILRVSPAARAFVDFVDAHRRRVQVAARARTR